MPEGQHARFSPSKLEQIILCPGSLQLSEKMPEQPESKYAAEGTLLHEYADTALGILFPANCEGLHKPVHPVYPEINDFWNKVNPEVEHMSLVMDCMDALCEYVIKGEQDFNIIRDTRVFVTGDECHGTLDLALETPTAVHILDFKFGAGVEVSADDNPQLMAYTIGYMKMKYPDSIGWQDKEIWNWIFQPRLDKFVGVRVFGEDLDYFLARLEKTIRVANGHFPPVRPGLKQCRWCRAGAVCKARMHQVQEDASAVFSEFADLEQRQGQSDDMCSIEDLARILQMEPQIDSAMKAIREHLFNKAMSGYEVPGYKLTTGRGSRKWNPDLDVEDLHAAFPELDTQDMLEVELKSVAKLEKLLPSKQRKTLEQFYTKVDGAPVLTANTSLKQALDASGMTPTAQAQKAFADFADAEDLS